MASDLFIDYFEEQNGAQKGAELEKKWRFKEGGYFCEEDGDSDFPCCEEKRCAQRSILESDPSSAEEEVIPSKCERICPAYGYFYSYNPQSPGADGAIRFANIKVQKEVALDSYSMSKIRILKRGVYKINYGLKVSGDCFCILRLIIEGAKGKCISQGSVRPISNGCAVNAATIECLLPGDMLHLSIIGRCKEDDEYIDRITVSNAFFSIHLIDC